jgi:autophagy-related protein 17
MEKSLSLLDDQDHALQLALKSLEDCVLDPAIQLSSSRLENSLDNDVPPSRTLRSFVDEDGVARLKTSITDAIDQIRQTHNQLQEETANIAVKISNLKTSKTKIKATCSRDNLEEAHSHTNLIATDAHEMATLLESLARHYDQCTQAYELSLAVNGGHSSTEQREELEELTVVLKNDADELEDVLTELYERREAISNSADFVVQFLHKVERDHLAIVALFREIDTFGENELANYDTRIAELTQKHHMHKDQVMSMYLPEMASLTEYYRLFLTSYHSMILEISRRKKFQEKLNDLAAEMHNKLSKVIEEEISEREQFLENSGSYLPGDLWPGLLDPPGHLEVVLVDEWKLPELSKTTLNTAKNVLHMSK